MSAKKTKPVRSHQQLIEHRANTEWITPTLANIKACLMAEEPPKPAPDCELCAYVKAANDAVGGASGETGPDFRCQP